MWKLKIICSSLLQIFFFSSYNWIGVKTVRTHSNVVVDYFKTIVFKCPNKWIFSIWIINRKSLQGFAHQICLDKMKVSKQIYKVQAVAIKTDIKSIYIIISESNTHRDSDSEKNTKQRVIKEHSRPYQKFTHSRNFLNLRFGNFRAH